MANLPALTPTTFAEAMIFAETLAKSTMVPREYQNNPANILLAVQHGAEVGLGPLQALQSIAVINGRPVMWGDSQLALVKGSPLCEDIIERIERDPDDPENRIAVCEARRKGREPVFGRFSIKDAKRAKLWGKSGTWQQYPARMLKMRARGFALRDAFPDVLRGVISAEEAADIPRQAKDVTPAVSVAAELDAFAAPAASQGEVDMGLECSAEAQERDPAPQAAEQPDPEDAPSAASVEASELPLEEPVTIAALKPARHGRGWDWPGYADAVLEAARALPRDHLGAFRVANASMLNTLRMSNREQWSRVQQSLADIELSGDE